MLELKDYLKKLEDSLVYKGWKADNKDSFLYIFFRIMGGNDNNEDEGWEIGFFDRKKDSSTSFIVNSEVKISAEDSKIFKHKDEDVNDLDIDKVKIGPEQALSIIEKIRNDKYKNEVPSKKIVILQKIDVILWNITYITNNFNTLNFKIDAISGDVIEDTLKPALSFRE